MGGLRVCMLTTFYPPYSFGGDGIAVQRLSHALARRGHHVTVVHDVDAYHASHPGPIGEAAPEPAGLEVVGLRSGAGALGTLLVHQLGRPVLHRGTIRRILDAGAFDVINFHNVSLVGGPGLLTEGRGIKLYLAHEYWLVCPSHTLWRHQSEACTGRQCFRCVLRYGRPPQLWRRTGYLARCLEHVDAFLVPSEAGRAKHAEFGFAPAMEVLPGLVPDAEPPAVVDGEAAPVHPRPFFLFSGRLERLKGLDDVISLFRDYREADLLIAGDGTHGEALRRLARGLPRVRFLGRLSWPELRRHYAQAVALIVPSRCFETFGLIMIEAFQEGTPVIARRLGALPEIVEQAGAGLLFGDARELLAAMERLRTEPGLRERLGRAGHAASRERWSERAVVARYLDIVRRVAERKGDWRVAAKVAAATAE